MGFTYLRDNMAQLEQELVGRGGGRGWGGREGMAGGGRVLLNVEERREWRVKTLKGMRVVRKCRTLIMSSLCM